MKKFGLLSTSAIGSAALFGMSMALATPAYAQDQECTDEEVAAGTCDTEQEIESGQVVDESEGQALIVTGTRIARPNLESTVPITTLAGEDIFEQAQINVGDTLNDLPQLRSTFGQTNAGRFLGTTGLNLLDLRGLGTVRTLTLVNGRRHVPSDILANGTSTDVNTIPTDLIDRVDIVTGGNSAIYGSDAIAGVVNFILRRDFEGIQLRGHATINDQGTFPGQYISAMVGHNFLDDRANVTLHAEYSNQGRVFASDVPKLRRDDRFLVIDTDPAGSPNGSDGFPDRAFFRDVRSRSININSLVPISRLPGSAACGTGINNVPYNCIFVFTPDGRLVPEGATSIVGTGPIGSAIGGAGQTAGAYEGTLLTVLPTQERINVNLLGHVQISEAFEPFVEAKWVRIDTQGQQSSPAFLQGLFVTFGDEREAPRLDNPFLSDQARNLIRSQLLASGRRGSLINNAFLARPLTAADIAAINDGSFRFDIARFTADLGSRDEQSRRELVRGVVGVRGNFWDSFNYEVSANYGRVDEDTRILGNIVPQRLLLAMDAARDPAGNIVCRSQIDPAAAFPYQSGNDADVAALDEDIANCVPYNLFGQADNSAAADYILEDTISRARLEQLVLGGFVSGDTSSFFELWGGPIGFAIGAEYRREELFYQADPIVEAGRTFYNALPTFAPEPFDVKEAFAEIRIPVLRDMPFFEDLSLSAAARVSDYGGSVGTVWAYNAGAEWSPIRDIRFRGQYGRSVRAPNLTETSFPITQNFAPGFQDPCRAANIGAGSQFRAANCLADLGPDLLASIADLPNYSLEILSGSNPNLLEESSDSWTFGAVIQPRWIPGLSVTVDYFDITVNDVITAVTAQTLVNTCYDLPNLENPFCDLINRFQGPGLGPNQEVPGQILDANLVVSAVNFAALTARGIDTEIAYRRRFGDDNSFETRFIYTHMFERSNFVNPGDPDFENRVLGELGDPQDEFRWDVALRLRNITLGYQMRYIGEQYLGAFENVNPLQDRPPENLDFADIIEYPETFYHNARVEFELEEAFHFTIGVDNILDTPPPLDLTGIGAGSAIYPIRGRSFYASARIRF